MYMEPEVSHHHRIPH